MNSWTHRTQPLPWHPRRALKRLVLRQIRRDVRCVFVLSTGRCGTTSLASLLNLSDSITAVHEPRPRFLEETKALYETHRANIASVERNFLNGFQWTRYPSLLEAWKTSSYYAECSNRLTYAAPALARHFKKAQFIHLYRHPADVVRSAMRRGYYTGDHVWDPSRITPRQDDDARSHWESWTEFEKCCWYWKAVNEFSCRFGKSVGADRCFSLPAEMLFENNEETLLHLFHWLGAEAPAQHSRHDALSEPQNTQTQGKFPLWDDWSLPMKQTLSRIASPVAEQLGYDLS